MIQLDYFDGKHWIHVSEWKIEKFAWLSLGGDDFNYRTVDENGDILTDKSYGNNLKKYLESKNQNQ